MNKGHMMAPMEMVQDLENKLEEHEKTSSIHVTSDDKTKWDGYNSAINIISDKVVKAESSINTLNSDLTTTKSTVSSQGTQISNLSNDLNTTKSTVSSHTTSINTLNSKWNLEVIGRFNRNTVFTVPEASRCLVVFVHNSHANSNGMYFYNPNVGTIFAIKEASTVAINISSSNRNFSFTCDNDPMCYIIKIA